MGRAKRRRSVDEGEGLSEQEGGSSEKRMDEVRMRIDENDVEKKRMTRSSVKAQMSGLTPRNSSESVTNVKNRDLAEYGNRAVHPLLIDLILDKVFGYVLWNDEDTKKRIKKRRPGSDTPATGIRNVRLVCKLWRERATLLFRRTRPPIAFGILGRPNPVLESEKFLEVMQTSSMMHVQRYSLGPTVVNEENQILLKNFFKICGPSAVEIQLDYNGLKSMPGMMQNNLGFSDPTLTLDLGKLKTLIVLDWPTENLESDPTQRPLMKLTSVMLDSAPNLQKLSLSVIIGYPWNEVHQSHTGKLKECLLEVVRRIPASVKALHLHYPRLWNSHWNVLAGIKNLALSELALDFHPTDFSSIPVIRKVLQQHAATLKN